MPNARLSPNLANIPSNLAGLQTQIEQFTDQLDTSSERKTTKNDKFSLFSPRLFALYPKKKSRKIKTTNNFFDNLTANISQLLSPDIFALNNQKSSTFSFSNLFPLGVIGQKEQIEWLDLFMNMTGMSQLLGKKYPVVNL